MQANSSVNPQGVSFDKPRRIVWFCDLFKLDNRITPIINKKFHYRKMQAN